MRASTAAAATPGMSPVLRGACEKSACSVLSVLRREAPAGTLHRCPRLADTAV
jgi:hypothetical protein